MGRPPLVGISCDRRVLGKHPFSVVGEKYIAAVRDGADATPFLIPALTPPLGPEDIVGRVDGLLFTGSPSNVAPSQYGGVAPRDPRSLDEARDAFTLPLLRVAIDARLPVLCICRGFQELNVALGGTLHQHVQDLVGFSDHREQENAPLDQQYGPSHPIRVVAGGLLAKMVSESSEIWVNSLHEQGIDRLAAPLRVEAAAPDGLIEAVSMPDAKGFLLGLQWHPEWKFADNSLSRAIFAGFGQAARAYAERRAGREP